MTPLGTNTPTATPQATATPSPTPAPVMVPVDAFMQGVHFTGAPLNWDTPGMNSLMTNVVRPIGAGWVVANWQCPVQDLESTYIDCTPSIEHNIPTDEALRGFIRMAHANGFRVAQFTGTPEAAQSWDFRWKQFMRRNTEADWDAFFASYTENQVHYATIAEEEGVDLFIFGSEIPPIASSQTERMRKLIHAIRAVYHGPVTFGGWWSELDNIQFWDELDYIGVSCYELWGGIDNPTVEQVRQEFEPVIATVKRASERYGKQVIFTETGAMSYHNATRWGSGFPNMQTTFNLSLDDQARFYEGAFGRLLEERDTGWLAGVFVYGILNDPGFGGPGEPAEFFYGKPSQYVLQRLFGGSGEIMPFPATTPGAEAIESTTRWLYHDGSTNVPLVLFPFESAPVEMDPAYTDPLGEHGKVINVRVNGFTQGIAFWPDRYGGQDYVLEFWVMVPAGASSPSLTLHFETQDGWLPQTYRALSYLAPGADVDIADGQWHRVRFPLNVIGPNTVVSSVGISNGWPGDTHRTIEFSIAEVRFVKLDR